LWEIRKRRRWKKGSQKEVGKSEKERGRIKREGEKWEKYIEKDVKESRKEEVERKIYAMERCGRKKD